MYLPVRPRNKLYEILEKLQKNDSGCRRAYRTKKQNLKVASNLILAEGAEGYKSEEAWANAITIYSRMDRRGRRYGFQRIGCFLP